jgi:hypothetical protein
VIPIQFVFFTLSAIIGSAILYGDFRTAKFHAIVTFLYGCAATFAGVFIIAWSPKESVTTLAHESDAERNEAVGADDAEVSHDGPHLGTGSIGRRRRATLVLPSGVRSPSREPPLRPKATSLTTMGISPAQVMIFVTVYRLMILSYSSISCWCILHFAMYQVQTDQRTRRMRTVDLTVCIEGAGVGMVMMPFEPVMRTLHEIAALLQSGETCLGWRLGISILVLCTYLPHVDSCAYFIYRDSCLTL